MATANWPTRTWLESARETGNSGRGELVDFDDGQVTVYVGADDGGPLTTAIGEDDFEVVATLDDVVVGDDVALVVEHEAAS